MPLKLTRRHGSPYWYVRGSVRGIALDESTGVADRKVAETIRAKREWELIQRSIHGIKATATFLEAAVGYLEGGGERRFLKKIVDHFGTMPLASIDQAAVESAGKRLYPRATLSTLNRQLFTPVSAVLRYAAARGLCDLHRFERPRQPRGRVRWIAPAEAERLIDASAKHLRPLLVFLLYTGARLSEALYLDWQQVNLERGEVQFIDTKNGEARGVPLHPRVNEMLSKLAHRKAAVFRRSDGLPYSAKANGGGQIKTGFRGACRRAGIADFSPHDCRHTWATWHYAANRDLPALMKLGGWKSEKMVLRYAHVNVAHLAQTIAALPWGNSGKTETRKRKKQRASRR